MDVESIEAFSMHKQSIMCHLMVESNLLEVLATDLHVISHTINHFNSLAPLPNQCLN